MIRIKLKLLLLFLFVIALSSSVFGSDLKFAVIGDYGNAGSNAEAVSNLVKSWEPGLDFIMTLGDNSYLGSGCGGEDYDRSVGSYYQSYVDARKFWPSLGNHDHCVSSLEGYRNYFSYLPDDSGSIEYYKKSFGLVDIFAIDSQNGKKTSSRRGSTYDVQHSWIQQSLSSSQAKHKIVFFHHSPYTLGGHSETTGMQKERWDFAGMGATAVMYGHDHNYQRFTIDGIPYILNGFGGAGTYNFERTTSAGYTPEKKYSDKHGAMLVTVNDAQINYKFYNKDGELIDDYTQNVVTNPSRGSGSQTSTNPLTSSTSPHMPCSSTTKCEELHKVWSKIGPMMGKNNFWKPSGKFVGGWVTNFDQLGLQPPEVQPISSPSQTQSSTPAPVTSATGIDHLAKTDGTPYMRAFLRMVKEGAKTSCGQVSAYQTLVGGTASVSPRLGVRGENGCNENYFVGFESHPNIMVSGTYGLSTAAGRYQFLTTTWNSWNPIYNNNGDFSPLSQDEVVYKFIERKEIGPILESMGSNPDINSQSFITSWQKIMAPTVGTMNSMRVGASCDRRSDWSEERKESCREKQIARAQRLTALDGGNFNGVSGGKGLGSIWASLPYGCYAAQGCHGVNSDRSSQTASYYKNLLEEELSSSPNPSPSNSVAMDLQGKKVLYIGDSHVAGIYGKEMDRLLKTVAGTVETYGCVGSSAGHFVSGGFNCKGSLGSTFKNSVRNYTLPLIL